MTPAEESVLAALLESAGCLHEIALAPEDFSSIPGEALYRLIQDAVEAGLPADSVTIASAARSLEDGIRRLVTPELIWRIAGIFVPAAAVTHHAGIVAQDSARRRLVTLAATIGQGAAEGADLSALVDEAQTRLSGLMGGMGSTLEALTDNMDATIEGLDQPATYVETPWRNLNDFVNGWKKGALYIIGARPSVGKTVAGFQAAVSLCNMGPVAYTSLEMSVDELQLRWLSQQGRVDIGHINRKQLSNAEIQRIAEARVKWGHLPLYVDPSNDATLAQIARHAWSVKRKHGLAAVVVDYVGLIEGRPGQKEYEVVTESSRKLKLLAQALDVPIIALSQLNRGSEGRDGKVPQMSDLRASGGLEQDADVVVLLHRDIMETPYEMKMIVAKNRQGITGTAHFDFVGHHSMIRDA
jgi:replicative DNA helicase